MSHMQSPLQFWRRAAKDGLVRSLISNIYKMQCLLNVALLCKVLQKFLASTDIRPHTLHTYLKYYKVDYKFAALSDHNLDLLVKTFWSIKPESGIQYLIGFLRNHGLRIQKSRVVASINHVDRLGHTLWERTTIQHWKYKVKPPKTLWHMDGHHKLIHWGIVIHGFIDGYCHTICVSTIIQLHLTLIDNPSSQVTGLWAGTNNCASTVLEVFLDAVGNYGFPSHGCGDRGGENKDVSVCMILVCGPNWASFMWGSCVLFYHLYDIAGN